MDYKKFAAGLRAAAGSYALFHGAPRGDLEKAADVIEELAARLEPSSTPLTLDELREMDGEPVWVVELNDYLPHWGLVYWCRKNKRNIVYVTINNGASICAETFIAAGGQIYRRKPEEG